MRNVYTWKARQDLHDIYEYIAYELLASEAAKGLTGRIMREIRTLETMADQYPLYKDDPWRGQGVRFLPVKNYLVFYMADASAVQVIVLRIMYDGRDIRRQLQEDTE